MSLHSEAVGRGTDLVLLHGWGMNAGVWAPLVEAMSSDFRLTLVELPGHGASGYDAGRQMLADWAAQVSAVAPPGAVWVGWSLGAQVALRAALDAPQALDGLVLVAGTPRFVQAADWPHAMAERTFHQFADSLQADPAATLERFLALQVRGAEHARETLRWLRHELGERPGPHRDALANGLDLLLSTDLRTELRRLCMPVLWLLGERDTLVPAGMAHDLECLQPDAEVRLIPGAAHAPFLSHPERTLGPLRRFLAEAGRYD